MKQREGTDMKQRVVTALIAGAFFVGMLCGMFTVCLPILVAAMSVIAVIEVERCVGMKNVFLTVLSCLAAAFVPFAAHFELEFPLYPCVAAYAIVFLCVMVICHEKLTFASVASSLLASLLIPAAFTSMIKLRDVYKLMPDRYSKAMGVFLVLLGIFASWCTDIFAYLVGRKLGKHKLCPSISPK